VKGPSGGVPVAGTGSSGDMPQKKKKQSNSSANGLEILKWELRKRGIRPTGTQENMVKFFLSYLLIYVWICLAFCFIYLLLVLSR